MTVTEEQIMQKECYLKGIIFLNSPRFSNETNQLRAIETFKYIIRKELQVDTEELIRIMYTKISGNYQTSPYVDFEPGVYQNSNPEEVSDIQEVLYIMSVLCGHDTTWFHQEVKDRHADFNTLFSWAH